MVKELTVGIPGWKGVLKKDGADFFALDVLNTLICSGQMEGRVTVALLGRSYDCTIVARYSPSAHLARSQPHIIVRMAQWHNISVTTPSATPSTATSFTASGPTTHRPQNPLLPLRRFFFSFFSSPYRRFS